MPHSDLSRIFVTEPLILLVLFFFFLFSPDVFFPQSARYCNAACQKSAWDAGHKALCKPVPEAPRTLDPSKHKCSTGLQNLGNTCFMNSSLQALSAVWPLTEYFLSNKYLADINLDNPLGTKGKLVKAYGSMLTDLWSGQHKAVAPSDVKRSVSSFTERDIFRGFQQHDAQELLNFLIDGLHEDLNLVKKKLAVVDEESDGSRDDAEVAKLSWEKYLLRNRSVVVDTVAGSFRNEVKCLTPGCGRVSIKFDPFHVWTVPIAQPAHSMPDRFVAVYLMRLAYDPDDPRTWNLLPTGDAGAAGSGASAFWSKPRSEEADFRGITPGVAGTTSPFTIAQPGRVTRYLVKVPKRSPYPVKEIRARLSLLANVAPECLVFEVVNLQSMMLQEVLSDESPVDFPKLQDALQPQRSVRVVHNEAAVFAFETAAPSWQQPAPPAGAPAPLPAAEQAPLAPTLPPRPPSQRVLLLTEVKGVESHPSSYSRDELTKPDMTWEQAFENTMSLGPLVLSVSLDTTITQLRLLAARQVFPLVGPRLRVSMEKREGRTVSDCEVTRELASMLLVHTHNFSVASTASACWLPSIKADGTDADAARPASRMTIGSMEGSFVCKPLVNGPRTSLDFVWSKLVIFLRGALRDFVDTSAKGSFVFAKGVREEEEEVRAKLSAPLSLEQCMERFGEPETLDEQNLWFCSRCKLHVQAQKTLQVWSMPRVVFIHLKRFRSGKYGALLKAEELVEFPLSSLDLSRFALEKKAESMLYDCVAVINHMGGMGGGHYTAYANHRVSQFGSVNAPELAGAAESSWRSFDDSYVDDIDAAKVVSKAAYVLVYQRRESR